MKYAVINGITYTGVVYNDERYTPAVISHHLNLGEWILCLPNSSSIHLDRETFEVTYGPTITKRMALDAMLDKVDHIFSTDEKGKTFDYMHSDGNTYPMYSDILNIQGQYIALSLLPADSIIRWKTAVKDTDEVSNIYLDLTVQEFTSFVGQFFMWMKSTGFDSKDAIKNDLKTIYLDVSSSVLDIVSHTI